MKANCENVNRIDSRVKIAALWAAMMLCYTYADILGFYAPGNLAELMSAEIAGIAMTQQVLFGSAVLMVIPTLMIYLSTVLELKANRLVNLIAAGVYLLVLIGTFFTGRNPAYYILFAVVKAGLLGLIIWYAWKELK